MFVIFLTPVSAFWIGDSGNNLDLSKLQPGDLILEYNPKFALLIPGHWTHVAIYIGDGKIVEATEDGVVVNPVTNVHKAYEAAIYRVKTTDSVRRAAIEFALKQVGKPYDYKWLTYVGGKEVYGDSYYCSELAWAAYLAAGGPDIDANPGWSWKYGYNVAPQEVADDGDTVLIAYSE
nr:YiiX/YebB-like N1pC/P60 family cysteine hydrolase [Archaeoglobus neptunius]